MKSTARTYRLGERAVSKERTSERILKATIHEFWAAPSPDIRLDAVAERAGVSVQTVLRHYGSKVELLARAAQWQADSVRANRDPADVNDAVSAARQLVVHYEEVGDGVMRLLAEESRIPALADLLTQGRDFHREWCEAVFASSLDGLPTLTRRRRLAQFVAICDVYTWHLLRRQSGLSRTATQQALAELIADVSQES
jgi:AcrR family transcriptional regulator